MLCAHGAMRRCAWHGQHTNLKQHHLQRWVCLLQLLSAPAGGGQACVCVCVLGEVGCSVGACGVRRALWSLRCHSARMHDAQGCRRASPHTRCRTRPHARRRITWHGRPPAPHGARAAALEPQRLAAAASVLPVKQRLLQGVGWACRRQRPHAAGVCCVRGRLQRACVARRVGGRARATRTARRERRRRRLRQRRRARLHAALLAALLRNRREHGACDAWDCAAQAGGRTQGAVRGRAADHETRARW
jgi:hypothetical protein